MQFYDVNGWHQQPQQVCQSQLKVGSAENKIQTDIRGRSAIIPNQALNTKNMIADNNQKIIAAGYQRASTLNDRAYQQIASNNLVTSGHSNFGQTARYFILLLIIFNK